MDTQLPPYFPLKLSKCAIPADAFFGCYEQASVPVPGQPNPGLQALQSCAESLQAYKSCMEAFVGPRAPR